MFYRKINTLFVWVFMAMLFTHGVYAVDVLPSATNSESSSVAEKINDKSQVNKTISVVTEDTYPLQYVQNGEVVGRVTELIRAVLDDAGFEYHIKVKPWARAYNEALATENTLIYSMARTKEREAKFKWIGSVMQIRYFLVGLDTLELPQPITLDSLKNLPVGAVRDSATHQYLVKHGFTNIYEVSHPRQSIRMLKQGRIQLFPVHYDTFQLSCINMRENCQNIVPHMELNGLATSLYFAMSNDTDDKVVEKVRTSYQNIMHVTSVQ